MRYLSLFATLALGACLLTGGTQAQEKKETTLKGTIMCASCALKEGKTCQTLIQVKENGKDVNYYFIDKGNAETYHENVCGGEKEPGSVIGLVSEKDGKKWVTPKKVNYEKK